MSQGFLMFDASKRLVICNRQYIAIYRLSPDIVKPGCTFRELMRHRKEAGTLRGDVEQACADLDARAGPEQDHPARRGDRRRALVPCRRPTRWRAAVGW